MPTIPTELTVGLIINIMAVILSLVSTYFPGFREIYAAWDSAHKALFQLYIVTGIVLVAALLTFTKVLVLVTPDVNGVLLLIVMWGTALYSNQTTYGYSQPPQSVLDAKAGRTQN